MTKTVPRLGVYIGLVCLLAFKLVVFVAMLGLYEPTINIVLLEEH